MEQIVTGTVRIAAYMKHNVLVTDNFDCLNKHHQSYKGRFSSEVNSKECVLQNVLSLICLPKILII